MHFGLRYANIGPLSGRVPSLEITRFAEEAGFESIWTIEHVVIPAGYQSAYPYSDDGRFGWPETLDYPDPLMWMGVVAGATERIKLGTAIVILPQRNPVVLAKELATLDAMSDGRVLFGVGVGWLREEFEAIGVPFGERAARTDEAIEVLRVLWRDDEASFDGQFTSLDRALMFPKPAQPNGVPIHIGGHSPAAARRAGRLGDGFFPARATPDTLPPLLAELNRAAEEVGRDPSSVEITAGSAFGMAEAERFAELGAERIMCPLMLPDLLTDVGAAKAKIEGFRSTIMDRF
ncbi:MAG: LLM class F420-dependent oxidoreductase [Actinomycetia bacterium]|nr:LLM class F420-dependent oxidoreductase [Actinomycetes bacterium]MCP4086959.1 LLM class F420-dependent oxidoreductase [Actinomycetes bacterium]